MNQLEKYLQLIKDSALSGSLTQIFIMNPINKESTLKKIHIKPILLKEKLHLSFVNKHLTKDITKNQVMDEAMDLIRNDLENNFSQSLLTTTQGEYHLSVFKNGKIKLKHKPDLKTTSADLKHDHSKKTFLQSEESIWNLLGFTNNKGLVYKEKQKKFRQINRYIEIITSYFDKLDSFNIVDMGCGKAYLSFALYSFLKISYDKPLAMTGVEIRKELVEANNTIAQKASYSNLNFVTSSIEAFLPTDVNVLIALHACDTATDDSILKGINANAQLIVCSPCCHKQVRLSLDSKSEHSKVMKYGILQERQCEIITDVIRAGVLEAFGYNTKVMEFISTSHTPKNLLIIAEKKSQKPIAPNETILKELRQTLKDYGIKNHYLLDHLKVN